MGTSRVHPSVGISHCGVSKRENFIDFEMASLPEERTIPLIRNDDSVSAGKILSGSSCSAQILLSATNLLRAEHSNLRKRNSARTYFVDDKPRDIFESRDLDASRSVEMTVS